MQGSLYQAVQTQARSLGFNFAGVTRAVPSPDLDAYLRWVDADMYGSMGYMARPDRIVRRQDLNVILPGVQSMILVGMDYRPLISDDITQDPSRGRIASYAWGLDYHDIMTPRLEAFAQWFREYTGVEQAHRVYVDTGAILERSHAMQAGLGFTGKNTLLINPRRGSYFFLGEILTTYAFDDYDLPHRRTQCGNCTRCLNACPTDAFPQPYVLDARRCISYLTIEHRGWIDHALRPLIGNWVYGCDVCQEVCPWQRFTHPATEPAFVPQPILSTVLDRVAPRIVDLLQLDDAQFKAQFAGSAIIRIKRERMVRNACVAAGNWGDSVVIQPLMHLLQNDASPIVRGHAGWALQRILGESARPLLTAQYAREDDSAGSDDVRAELAFLLENGG